MCPSSELDYFFLVENFASLYEVIICVSVIYVICYICLETPENKICLIQLDCSM